MIINQALSSYHGSSCKGAANCFDPRTDLHSHGVEVYDPQQSQVESSHFAGIPGIMDSLSDIASWLLAIWSHSRDLSRYPMHTARDVPRNTHRMKVWGIQAVGTDALALKA